MKINQIDVKIVKGDIATIKADGYVVPQYRNDTSKTGVSARIVCSPLYRAVMDYEMIAKYATQIPFGYAIALPVMVKRDIGPSHLIHVATLGVPEKEAFKTVQLAVWAALKEAERCGLSEIAIPTLGTGENAPLDESMSAKAIMSAIASYKSTGVITKVTIPIFGSGGMYRKFVGILRHSHTFEFYSDPTLQEQYEALTMKMKQNFRANA